MISVNWNLKKKSFVILTLFFKRLLAKKCLTFGRAQRSTKSRCSSRLFCTSNVVHFVLVGQEYFWGRLQLLHARGKKAKNVYLSNVYSSSTLFPDYKFSDPLPDQPLFKYGTSKKLFFFVFFFVWRDPGVNVKGQISRLPEQPCWLYA